MPWKVQRVTDSLAHATSTGSCAVLCYGRLRPASSVGSGLTVEVTEEEDWTTQSRNARSGSGLEALGEEQKLQSSGSKADTTTNTETCRPLLHTEYVLSLPRVSCNASSSPRTISCVMHYVMPARCRLQSTGRCLCVWQQLGQALMAMKRSFPAATGGMHCSGARGTCRLLLGSAAIPAATTNP